MKQERTKPTSVRLPPKLARQLAALAKQLDRSQGWVLRKAVEAYVRKEQP